MFRCLLSVFLFINFVSSLPSSDIDRGKIEDASFWIKSGQDNLRRVLNMKEASAPVAKNIVMFVGDGMGMTTITASRIYKGQRGGKAATGEGYSLAFEEFPNIGLSKTYNVDKQVPDSAATATAMFSGVKTRYTMLGVDSHVMAEEYEGPDAMERAKLTSIMDWAQAAGKRTGFVTTTRVTHATPAALYAKTTSRDWECDLSIPEEFRKKEGLKDIARQLVQEAPGNKLNVILAGGADMLGNAHSVGKPEDSACQRGDGRDLVAEWLATRPGLNAQGMFVNTTSGLEKVKVNQIDYLMGIFSADHMPYNAVRDKGPNGTPSIALMTKQALGILKRPDQGFVLMVEGGRIDHAHHKNYAKLALDEASELDDAVRVVLENTDPEETLVIVTADHSHAFTVNGYPERNNDILGFTNENTTFYETLSYANGPGYTHHRLNDTNSNETWRDVQLDEERNSPFYQNLATIYLDDETHGGEDVPVYATGPCSHLIRGVFEQNYIGHVISYAGCMGPSATLNPACSNDSCKKFPKRCKRNSASVQIISHTLLSATVLYVMSQHLIS